VIPVSTTPISFPPLAQIVQSFINPQSSCGRAIYIKNYTKKEGRSHAHIKRASPNHMPRLQTTSRASPLVLVSKSQSGIYHHLLARLSCPHIYSESRLLLSLSRYPHPPSTTLSIDPPLNPYHHHRCSPWTTHLIASPSSVFSVFTPLYSTPTLHQGQIRSAPRITSTTPSRYPQITKASIFRER